MDVFPWKEQYRIGIAKLDEQHQRLVACLNEIYAALNEGKGREALGSILSGLVEYTKTHFLAEEAMMKLYDYPEYAHHREVHNKMTNHVKLLGSKFASGEITSPIQIANFLKDWLSKHIMETDRKYGPFFQAKGVR